MGWSFVLASAGFLYGINTTVSLWDIWGVIDTFLLKFGSVEKNLDIVAADSVAEAAAAL